jgi:hypothetical protein
MQRPKTGADIMDLKTIKAGSLKGADLDASPGDGWPCVMCHGFPYDVHAFAEAALRLTVAGARYLRFYGPTRFSPPIRRARVSRPRSPPISWRCSIPSRSPKRWSVATIGAATPTAPRRPFGRNGWSRSSDFVDIVIHCYRYHFGLVPGRRRSGRPSVCSRAGRAMSAAA